jgi:hypothetical protein
MKLIMLFNVRDGSFAVVDHNVPDAEADAEVRRRRGAKLPAFHLPQPTKHSAEPAEICRACAKLCTAAIEAKKGAKVNA